MDLSIYCGICNETISEGIFQTSCGHTSCCECFLNNLRVNRSYPIDCFGCNKTLSDKEYISMLRGEDLKKWGETRKHYFDLFDKFLQKCLNPECDGEHRHFEETPLIRFKCAKCKHTTCLKCKATHKEGQRCKDWRRTNKDIFVEREANKKYQQMKINKKNGMFCICGLFIERENGCFGMKCSSCKTELCFVTQKTRWGPMGNGDISGGCGCTSENKCHPDCDSCNIDDVHNNYDIYDGYYDDDDDDDDDDYDGYDDDYADYYTSDDD